MARLRRQTATMVRAAQTLGTAQALRLLKSARATRAARAVDDSPAVAAPPTGQAFGATLAHRTLAALRAARASGATRTTRAVRALRTAPVLRAARALRTVHLGEKLTPTTVRLTVGALVVALALGATFAARHGTAPSTATPDGGRSPAPSASGRVEAGPAIICADGTISHAAPRQGACSWHGGGAGSVVSIEGDTVPWTSVDASVPDVLTAPRAKSRDAAVRRVINAYYRALSRGNYRAAFRRLSTGQRERLGPGRTWSRKLTGTRYRHVDVLYLDDTPTGYTVTLSYDQITRDGTCTSTVLQRTITTEHGHERLADPTVLAQSPCA